MTSVFLLTLRKNEIKLIPYARQPSWNPLTKKKKKNKK